MDSSYVGTQERASAASTRQSGRLTSIGAALSIAMGLIGMVSWYAQWTTVLRWNGTTPMFFLTALFFTLYGVGAIAVERGRRVLGGACGALVLAGAGLVVAEHLLGRGLGIDELFVRAYLTGSTQASGRPALNTAACFLLAGVALVTMAGRFRAAALVTAVAGALIAAVAGLAFYGYGSGVRAAGDWGSPTQMALPTAVTLVAVALSLLGMAWGGARVQDISVPGLLVMPVAAITMATSAALWLSVTQVAGPTNVAADRAASIVAVMMSTLVMGSGWIVLRSERSRRVAEVEAARRAAATVVLAAGEARLRKFLDALPVGVIITTDTGTHSYANLEAARIAGRAVGADPGVVVPADFSLDMFVAGTAVPYPAERFSVARALRGEPSHLDDVEIHRPDGGVVAIEVWGAPILDDDGRLEFTVSALADVTARKVAERTLAEQTALLDLALDPIVVEDRDQVIRYWNRGAERTYGFTASEAIGRSGPELLSTRLPLPMSEIEAAIEATGAWEGELVQRARDGARIVVTSRWVPRRGPGGTWVATMQVNRDVTARKQAEAEFKRSNAELEQFAYLASHDLSEPLRSISGPLSVVAHRYQGVLDAEADEFIEFAVDGCTRMQALIDGLLDLSRVGRSDVTFRPTDCNTLMERVLRVLGPAIEHSGAIVKVDPLPEVLAEPTELTRVFQNLMANALKFVLPGVTPRVTVAVQGQGQDWRFEVTDNGLGVEPRHREHVFELFRRLNAREDYPGTGIGLGLVKKIVDRHGGEVGVESGPDGTGSRFWFTLPVWEDGRP